MSLRDMVTDRAFLGFWRLEKIAGRAFLGERVLPLLGFTVTLFGSAKRRWENVRRQAQLDHVIDVVKHKTIRATAVCANNTPCNPIGNTACRERVDKDGSVPVVAGCI